TKIQTSDTSGVVCRNLVFRQLQAISAGVDDVDRVAWTLAMNACFIHFDPFRFQLFDQLFRIAGSFDVKSVMGYLWRSFLRGVEKPEPGLASAQASNFDSADGVLGAHLRA